jgi:hypothetical protein
MNPKTAPHLLKNPLEQLGVLLRPGAQQLVAKSPGMAAVLQRVQNNTVLPLDRPGSGRLLGIGAVGRQQSGR